LPEMERMSREDGLKEDERAHSSRSDDMRTTPASTPPAGLEAASGRAYR
jgi:hypothetical protein